MNIDASSPKKRKASDLYEIVEDLANALNEYMERTDERVRNAEERLEDLAKIGNNCGKIKAPEEVEDFSDDDETVVDECDNWKDMYRQLREYKIFHGDCKVPFKYPDNPKLGFWVGAQKKKFASMKAGRNGQKIKPERIVALDRLGLDWGKKFPSPPSWDEMYERVKEYSKSSGNCNVPLHASSPTPLAKWCTYQRAEYKRHRRGRDSLITLDQIRLLNEIGFNWKGPKL